MFFRKKKSTVAGETTVAKWKRNITRQIAKNCENGGRYRELKSSTSSAPALFTTQTVWLCSKSDYGIVMSVVS